MNYYFTSESISEGHPDKMADQISDAILDAYLRKDKNSRVACETLISNDFVVLAGEISSKAKIDAKPIVREVCKNIGYDDSEKGFDYKKAEILIKFNKQSPDISMGVDQKDSLGAGDQGIMFGYALNETKSLMPLSIELSHKLVKNLSHLRKKEKLDFLRPDSKSQVCLEYENQKVKRVASITLSTQHSPDISLKELRHFIKEKLIFKTIPSSLLDQKTQYFINPTGRFVIGGPRGDCGLTGRKIIADTYGGHGAHGGGAFSGKDPSKVDRSAAYMARHIAKTIVKANLSPFCLVQLSYGIGMSEALSLMIRVNSDIPNERLIKAVNQVWDLTPSGIIDFLDLLNTSYQKTASYGHFGRENEGFLWEDKDMTEAFKKAL